MEVIQCTEKNDIANVYIARNPEGKYFEFVESVQPPLTAKDKWVIILSTLFGCPVKCRFCDAGGSYSGKLNFDEMMFQVNYLVRERFGSELPGTAKFKIQFARMGEPTFNPAVLEVLEELPDRFPGMNLIPSLSTVAPHGVDGFLERLKRIRKAHYEKFQLQFSIHTTNTAERDRLIPVKKWGFEKIATFGKEFVSGSANKVTLNFAMSENSVIDTGVLISHFDPEVFLIKVTPVNPTYKARQNGLQSGLNSNGENDKVRQLKKAGYEVIVSIGDLEENKIGSNCGQYLMTHLNNGGLLPDSYTYALRNAAS